MKKELIKIIKELKEVIKEEKLKVNDNTLLEQSCSFLRGEMASLKRWGVQSPLSKTSKSLDIKSDSPPLIIKPATDKQKNLLYKLNADFNAENITKEEAGVLINELLDKEIEKNNANKQK